MELYIIRHGQSANNALADQRQRTYDPVLTDLGRQQAERLAQYLATAASSELVRNPLDETATNAARRGFGITHLYCSAMHRALQTAAPVAKALGVKPEVWIDIHEQGGVYLEETGVNVAYPGKTRSEILTEFPDYLLPEAITATGWYDVARGYEAVHVGAGRAIKVALELRRRASAEAKDARIAIITHGTFIDLLLKAFFGQLPNRHHFFASLNTSITRLDFHEDVIVLRYLNRVEHLPADLIT